MDQAKFTRALASAMEAARMNQSELGRAAGAAPAMLSAWLAGKTANPEPLKVFAVERALNLPPGHLSRHLGYVPIGGIADATDTLTAIETDPALDEDGKGAMRAIYRVLRARAGRPVADRA